MEHMKTDHFVAVFGLETMFTRRVKILPAIPSKFQRDLSWAFRPIFVWMQLLGIPTGQLHLSSAVRRYLFFVAGLVMMIWVSFSNIRNMFQVVQTRTHETNKKWSVTRVWSEALQEILVNSVSVLISLSLFIISQMRWPSIWKHAIEIEQKMSFDKTFYCLTRKISIAASMLLTMVRKFQLQFLEFQMLLKRYFQETVGLAYRCLSKDLLNLSIGATILDVGFWLSELYSINAVMFFMVLTWTASLMLQHLIDQLPVSEIPLHFGLNHRLLNWKRNFRMISDYIGKINSYFGVMLLAFLTRELFNFIFYIYWLMDELQEPINSYMRNLLIIYIIKIVIYVAFLALVSHRIKQKVLHSLP